jgi:hypothetical protein
MGLLAGFAAVEIIQITGNKIKESPERKLHQPRQASTEEAKSRHTPLSVTYVIVAERGQTCESLKKFGTDKRLANAHGSAPLSSSTASNTFFCQRWFSRPANQSFPKHQSTLDGFGATYTTRDE